MYDNMSTCNKHVSKAYPIYIYPVVLPINQNRQVLVCSTYDVMGTPFIPAATLSSPVSVMDGLSLTLTYFTLVDRIILFILNPAQI